MGRKMKESGIAWVGIIPTSWIINSLSQLCAQVKNKNSNLQETNLLSLSYGKIKRRSIESSTGLLPESFDGYNIIEKDDIVLRLTDLQNDQTSLRVGLAEERGIITSVYLTIRKQAEISAQYLFYYLYSFDILKGFYGMGGGVRQGLNWDGVKWLKVLVPPFEEQERIATYLSQKCAEIDAVLEKTRASIEEYKKLKQAIITRAVTTGIRRDRPMKESGIKWIGKIPETWTLSKIGSLYAQRNEKVSDKDFAPLSVTMKGIVPQLETAAKTDDGDNRKLVRKGDFVINSRSDRRGSCGISAYNGSVSLINIILMPRGEMHPGYYNWLFHTSLFADEFYKWGHGIVDDLWTTRWQEMKAICIPVPPYHDQERISSFLNKECANLDELIAQKVQLINTLESYKKSLIYEYVTGKKEVDNYD
jgi:type I restriction enzyme S subunit